MNTQRISEPTDATAFLPAHLAAALVAEDDETTLENQHREAKHCACGAAKEPGQITCWPCFKYVRVPLKTFRGSFGKWLAQRAERAVDLTPVETPVIERFDAPPYTIPSLDVGGDVAAMACSLLCGQAAKALGALAERLGPKYGTRVAPGDVFALATLRRDLRVTVERMNELARSIAGIKPGDVAPAAK